MLFHLIWDDYNQNTDNKEKLMKNVSSKSNNQYPRLYQMYDNIYNKLYGTVSDQL